MLNHEGEVAKSLVTLKNVAPEDTWNYIAGFAWANDVFYIRTDAGDTRVIKDGFCREAIANRF